VIQIKVRIKGSLKKPFGQTQFNYECAEGTTVAGLLKTFEYTEDQVRYIMASVNYDVKPHTHTLQNGDEVMLVVMVGGG
jgi:sulfur carrier protein ThiS